MPTLTPPDWQEPEPEWTNGDKVLCAGLPVVVALVTIGMYIAWKWWG